MSQAALQPDLLEAAVTALPADSLSDVRLAAAKQFASQGFPTTRHEDWKYTNLSDIAALSNSWLQEVPQAAIDAPATIDAPSAGVIETVDAHWIVVRNGIVDPLSFGGPASAGISVSGLVDGNAIRFDDPLSAFNAALLRDGLQIDVADGMRLEKPMGILLVDDGSQRVTQVRVLIRLGVDASLGVIECAQSNGDAQFANSVTQASLSKGASLDFVRLQQRSKSHMSVNRFAATLNAAATLNYTGFDFGGALARNDIVADIAGANAAASLHGLYLAAGRQHIDNHTRVDHRVGPATSREAYRGILTGRSRCVFNGKAVVHAGADGTDADQTNHNLLLSDNAEIDTKPELEIYADDVKCSHGATVGQLDKAALFYLRTRGLDRDQARQVLTRAFGSAILSELPIEACREHVTTALDRELDTLIGDG